MIKVSTEFYLCETCEYFSPKTIRHPISEKGIVVGYDTYIVCEHESLCLKLKTALNKK